jgi:hypothetical protein
MKVRQTDSSQQQSCDGIVKVYTLETKHFGAGLASTEAAKMVEKIKDFILAYCFHTYGHSPYALYAV